MSRKKVFIIASVICTLLSLFVAYAMAWVARDLNDFARHWAAFPNTLLVFALLGAAVILGIAAAEARS